MLVLTRKLQQQIKIGDQVTITILRVKGQTVRVGIEAPRDVRVIRGELPREGQAAVLAEDASEDSIEETTLVLTGQEPDEGEAADVAALAITEQVQTVSSPATPRLPQRRRLNRAGSPPLRLAMAAASPSLAK